MPEAEYLQFGGQAIVEGVMMRSPKYFSVACRAPNGEIVLRVEPIDSTWIGRQRWLKKPFLRGSLALIDSMALGYKALQFASNVQVADEYQPKVKGSAPETEPAEVSTAPPSQRVQDASVAVAMVGGLAIGLLLFNYLPNLIIERLMHVDDYRFKNLGTEILKMCLFMGYIYAIGRLPDIKRVFMYHGAEHKAINTLEAHQELTPENCLAQTRLHPRCGTSFAIVVLLISMLLFTFVPRYPFEVLKGQVVAAATVRFLLEIMILPLVAGMAYELIRIAGKFKNSSLIRFIFWPGLMTQYLTTNEPEASQVEVSLAALKAVVDAEQNAIQDARAVDEAASVIA